MKQGVYILYHKNCTDGFGAAYAAWLKYKNKAYYIPVNYGEPVPEIPNGSKVFLIDFCYDGEIVREMNEKYELIILDHHVSAELNVKLANKYVFDLKKSGASLAWEYFHPHKKNKLIKLIEDKDLWLFNIKDTKPVIAALESYPRDFRIWHRLTINRLRREGMMILKKQDVEVKMACSFHYFKNIGGHKVPVVNTSNYMSDVAEQLLQIYPDSPFVGVYYDYPKDGQLMRKWSLRSRKKTGVDVSKVAAKFGGGGHKTSSGFFEKVKGVIYE